MFHAIIARHAATQPAMRAAMAARRAAARRHEAELGLEYRWRFERLRQRNDGNLSAWLPEGPDISADVT